jgi:hypothetical protein
LKRTSIQNLRLLIAQILAGIALAIAMTIFIAGPNVNSEVLLPIIRTSVVTASVIGSTVLIVLSVAAFVLSLKRRSFLLAGLLAASGIIFLVTPMTLTPHMAAMGDPAGRAIHVASTGLPILGLGLAKGIGTARAATVTPR